MFENASSFEQIDLNVFSRPGLEFVRIPASIKVLGDECFSSCDSLCSVTFESESRLSQIQHMAFAGTGLVEMIIPSSVELLSVECGVLF
jgi:hypothetical protein